MIRFSTKNFILSMVLFGILVSIALYMEDQFVRPFLGDLLVVIWLYYTIKAFLDLPDRRVAAGALLFSFCVEFAQYFKVITWLGLEDHSVLSVLLGATFDFLDLLAYTLGWIVINGIIALSGRNSQFRGEV